MQTKTQQDLFIEKPKESNGATFSKDGKHRYALWRIWDESKPKAMFIGLNPSTANEHTDDPTIRRVKKMAENWGYGGIYMLNLFAYVSAYPDQILHCEAEEKLNLVSIATYAHKSDKVIFAWGNFKVAHVKSKITSGGTRCQNIIDMFPDDAYALHINKNGSPKHPLYIKSDVQPIKYKQ